MVEDKMRISYSQVLNLMILIPNETCELPSKTLQLNNTNAEI